MSGVFVSSSILFRVQSFVFRVEDFVYLRLDVDLGVNVGDLLHLERAFQRHRVVVPMVCVCVRERVCVSVCV